jgi:hypothetical protein
LEKEHLEADLAKIKAEEKEAWEKHQIKAQKYCDELFAQMQSAKQRRLDEKRLDEEEDRVQLVCILILPRVATIFIL